MLVLLGLESKGDSFSLEGDVEWKSIASGLPVLGGKGLIEVSLLGEDDSFRLPEIGAALWFEVGGGVLAGEDF